MPGLADGSVRRRWAACSLHQCLAVHDSSRVLCRAGAEDSASAPFDGQGLIAWLMVLLMGAGMGA